MLKIFQLIIDYATINIKTILILGFLWKIMSNVIIRNTKIAQVMVWINNFTITKANKKTTEVTVSTSVLICVHTIESALT